LLINSKLRNPINFLGKKIIIISGDITMLFLEFDKLRQIIIDKMEISLKNPGKVTQLPSYILDELKNLHPRYKRFVNFFGGHPVSITKQMSNQIFT